MFGARGHCRERTSDAEQVAYLLLGAACWHQPHPTRNVRTAAVTCDDTRTLKFTLIVQRMRIEDIACPHIYALIGIPLAAATIATRIVIRLQQAHRTAPPFCMPGRPECAGHGRHAGARRRASRSVAMKGGRGAGVRADPGRPRLAGPGRGGGRPDGAERMDLPADAPSLRRQARSARARQT